LVEQAKKRANESQHGVTLANVYMFGTMFEVFRGDAESALQGAETPTEIATRLDIQLYFGSAEVYRGWARARLGDRESGVEETRRGLTDLAVHKALVSMQLYQALLAELEADEHTAVALTRVDEALALAKQTEQRWTDSLLSYTRGDILLKAHPEKPARAEDGYITAIDIARRQGARSFGLQAALKLAKLYQSTGRLVETHAVLAPALEGFSPTPEMPEIAEAQALLSQLA
jgi:hypothetical protein